MACMIDWLHKPMGGPALHGAGLGFADGTLLQIALASLACIFDWLVPGEPLRIAYAIPTSSMQEQHALARWKTTHPVCEQTAAVGDRLQPQVLRPRAVLLCCVLALLGFGHACILRCRVRSPCHGENDVRNVTVNDCLSDPEVLVATGSFPFSVPSHERKHCVRC
ncbi:hypothetical protein LZ32DRAFT_58730 [Colletotrichum eremochloae]|nr:hypothetical protein LZ32DRAFT_58730 [Colletotrichum eremochloae]